MDKTNKRTIVVLIGFSLLFIILIIYLSYFQLFKSEDIKKNSYNKRLWMNEEKVLRGSIKDRNGNILAYNEKTEEHNIRKYNYDYLYSHIIGYSYREYGKSGLESRYNNILLDINKSDAVNDFKNIVLPSSIGNNLRLTIDHSTQAKSRELLLGHKGSIITMNPTSGEIYSMVSLPDFNVNNLKEEWREISENPNSPFLNRSTQGLYEPGSTYKIVTAAALLNNNDNLDLNFECKGSSVIDGYTYHDYGGKAHGKINLRDAIINSCNTYFVNKATDLGKQELGEMSEKFYINKEIEFDLATQKSSFNYKNNLSMTGLASSAIGQGEVLVTPLNMAMVASTIANDGKMVKPVLVKEIIDKDGNVIKTASPEIISTPLSEYNSDEIKRMMEDVVNYGTGKNASIKNIQLAGKTGSAENSSGKTHSWFIGFVSEENPKLAVAVVLEESDLLGAQGAAPIARDIIIHALNNINFEE